MIREDDSRFSRPLSGATWREGGLGFIQMIVAGRKARDIHKPPKKAVGRSARRRERRRARARHFGIMIFMASEGAKGEKRETDGRMGHGRSTWFLCIRGGIRSNRKKVISYKLTWLSSLEGSMRKQRRGNVLGGSKKGRRRARNHRHMRKFSRIRLEGKGSGRTISHKNNEGRRDYSNAREGTSSASP